MDVTQNGDDCMLDQLREFEHDVVHQLSTIAILAELVAQPDLSVERRELRKRRLMREVCWLRRFVRSERRRLTRDHVVVEPTAELPLGALMADVMATTRLMTTARVQLVVEPVTVCAERIALGRALRNLLWNAIAAAGADGEVRAYVRPDGDAAVVEIVNPLHRDSTRAEGLGLRVVREVVAEFGGDLHIDQRAGMHRVQLRLPRASAREDERCA